MADKLPIDHFKGLAEFLRETDLKEILIEDERGKVHIKRSSGFKAQPAPAPLESDGPVEPPKPTYLRSDMVGTFHRGDGPDRPPLVVDGTLIEAGQPVATIEAMKVLKDVTAPMTCRILKCLLVDGAPVEYGQPLYEVEPNPEG